METVQVRTEDILNIPEHMEQLFRIPQTHFLSVQELTDILKTLVSRRPVIKSPICEIHALVIYAFILITSSLLIKRI